MLRAVDARRLSLATAGAGLLAASPAPAQVPPADQQASGRILRYEAVSPLAPRGDRLTEARRIAAAVIAAGEPEPRMVVDIGSYTGEFLEAFLDQFPSAHGQWTEPVESNRKNAGRRLGRFGERVRYVIGCPARDISLGCVPKNVDVLISSWLTIHRDLAGIRSFHRTAFSVLPADGWIAILDHAGDAGWRKRLDAARSTTAALDMTAPWEGPPVHHPEFTTPTEELQLQAMREAGFADPRVVWRRLDTILMVGRKPGPGPGARTAAAAAASE